MFAPCSPKIHPCKAPSLATNIASIFHLASWIGGRGIQAFWPGSGLIRAVVLAAQRRYTFYVLPVNVPIVCPGFSEHLVPKGIFVNLESILCSSFSIFGSHWSFCSTLKNLWRDKLGGIVEPNLADLLKRIWSPLGKSGHIVLLARTPQSRPPPQKMRRVWQKRGFNLWFWPKRTVDRHPQSVVCLLVFFSD